MSGRLAGRTAIVTGGGRGIGRAIALAYAAEGANVLVTAARGLAEAEAVAAEATGLSGAIVALQADVTDEGDVARMVEAALALGGRDRIDILVNNAARGMRFVNPQFMTDRRPFYEADPAAWRLVIDTNVTGVFLVTRAVVPHMLAAGEGWIVNVTVNESTMRRPGFSPYGPSKAALESMTTVWAGELDGTGVAINLLLPGGATATGMVPEGFSGDLLDPEVVVPGALHLATTRESGQRIVGTEFR